MKKLWKKLVERFYAWLDKDLVADAAEFLGKQGRTFGHEPTFGALNPSAIAIFSAGLLVGERSLKARLFGQRVIWFGDLNLSGGDIDHLATLSRKAGDSISVLNRNRQVVYKVRWVGQESIASFSHGLGGILRSKDDGRYRYDDDYAREKNLESAREILENRGWLPYPLIQFYGLETPKVVKKARKARKKAAKKARRAKKRA